MGFILSVSSIKKKYIDSTNVNVLLIESILNNDHVLFDDILKNEHFFPEEMPLNILHFCILKLNTRAFLKLLKISDNEILNSAVGIPGVCSKKTPLDCLGPKPFPKYLMFFLNKTPRKKLEILTKTNLMRKALIERNAVITISEKKFKKELFLEILCQEFPFLNIFKKNQRFFEVSPTAQFVCENSFQEL